MEFRGRHAVRQAIAELIAEGLITLGEGAVYELHCWISHPEQVSRRLTIRVGARRLEPRAAYPPRLQPCPRDNETCLRVAPAKLRRRLRPPGLARRGEVICRRSA